MSKVQTLKFPLMAELNDLTNCINQMGERPLKLIAEKVYNKFQETKWDSPKWSFVKDDGLIKEKKLLSNPDDSFQFSLANNRSKQDFHKHKNIFEIYVSNYKMEISYIKDKKKESMCVSRGVMIVPPSLIHKIKLHGITFVFQGGLKGAKVHKDKEVKKVKFQT